MTGVSSSGSGSGVCVPEGAESYMDSAAVAYDTADMSDSARDSGLSWPPGSGALNADGGVGIAIIDLGGLGLARGSIPGITGGGTGSAGDDERDDESTTGGDKGAAGSGSGLDSDTGLAGCVASAAGTSCRLPLDDESLRERCCTSTGDPGGLGKPARGDREFVAALTLTLGIREVDPVPW